MKEIHKWGKYMMLGILSLCLCIFAFHPTWMKEVVEYIWRLGSFIFTIGNIFYLFWYLFALAAYNNMKLNEKASEHSKQKAIERNGKWILFHWKWWGQISLIGMIYNHVHGSPSYRSKEQYVEGDKEKIYETLQNDLAARLVFVPKLPGMVGSD